VTVVSGITCDFGYFHASRNDDGIVLKWQTVMDRTTRYWFKGVLMPPIFLISPLSHAGKNGTAAFRSRIPFSLTIVLCGLAGPDDFYDHTRGRSIDQQIK
jgi:hypothetical protein